MAQDMNVNFLGKVPLDPKIGELLLKTAFV